jgi:bifunctional ADP-heptose synthase (sugar kinase/adenylyltransferase)
MDIVIVGSVALDDVRTPVGEVKDALGGSAVYSSLSASYFAKAGIVGVVGEDFSEDHVKLLASKQIALDGLEKADGQTFHWAGYYEKDMGTAFTEDTRLNVFASFAPKIPSNFQKAPFVFLANIDPVLQGQVLDTMQNSEFVLLDTMNLWIETKREELMKVLTRVNMVVVNDAEARQISGEDNLLQAAKWIQDKGPQGVIIKKGEHGAIVFWDQDMGIIPAYPVPAVKDPTGAGDTFAGGFIGALAQQKSINITTLKAAAIAGTIMASFTVEDFSVRRLVSIAKKDVLDRHEKIHNLTKVRPFTLNVHD